MNDAAAFVKNFFEPFDWPTMWQCTQASILGGWWGVAGDFLIGSSLLIIAPVVFKELRRKKNRFVHRPLYLLLSMAVVSFCGSLFLDALFYLGLPLLRINALLLFIAGIFSAASVWYMISRRRLIFAPSLQKELDQERERRKNIEATLGNFETLTDHTQVLIRDLDGKITYWNQGMQQLYGFDKQEALGQITHQLFHTEFPQPLAEIEAQLLQINHWQGELLHSRKDASKLVVLSYWFLHCDADGKPIAVVETSNDITALKKAETDLRKAKKDFQSLVASVNDVAIFMVDVSGHIATWNSGAASIKGYEESEVIGRSIDILYPAGDAAAGLPQTNLKKALETGHYETQGYRVRKDGSQFYADIIFTPLYDEGKLYGYSKVTRDITAKRKAEERLQFLATIAENIQDPIISSDENSNISRWNSGAEKLLGWKTDEVIGKNITEIIQPIYPHQSREEIIATFSSEGFWHGELIYHTKAGLKLNILATISHLKDAAGQIKGILILARDITARKKAEEALYQLNQQLEQKVKERTEAIYKTEIRFRSLIENSAEGVSLLDSEGNVLYRSPSASNILGDNSTKKVLEMAHPVNLVDFKRKFAASLDAPGQPIPYQVQYLHHGGHYSWFEGTFTNLQHIESVNAVVANFRDVTARKSAEDRLLKQEQQYRYLFENNPMPMWIEDETSEQFLDVNISAVDHYGYNRQEFIAMNTREIRLGTEKISLQEAVGIHTPKAATHNKTVWEHVKKNGSIINVEVSAHPITFQNRAARLVLSNDVTDQKRAEEKIIKSEEHYRMLVEQSPNGIFLADQNGYYLDANEAACKMMGYSRSEIISLHLTDMLAVEELPRLPAVLADLQMGKIVTSDWKFKRKDHTIYFGELVGRQLPDGRYQGIVQDITLRTEVAKKIQKINAELEERVLVRTAQLKKTSEEMEAFSYSVSHDLRAPLRAIVGFASILEEDYVNKLDPEAKRIIRVIINNTVKMGRLIDDLLSFSRMGRQELVKLRINTGELVRQIIVEQNGQHEKNQPVNWLIGELPPSFGDQNTMRQVWVNLISNAVKYSGKVTQPVIEIGASAKEHMTTFWIKDNGVGFDPKYKAKLFKVFQRLHSHSDFEGTGIGLAIVEKIISRHGGEVWADAEPVKGATFYFSIPNK